MVRTWLAAALGSIFLAGSTTGASVPRNDRPPMRERPASSTREISTVDIACVSAAVAVREQAISTAAATQSQALASAYATRALSLQTAYAGTDPTTVKMEVKKTWEVFATANKGAKQTWLRSRENSWKTFREAVKACKGVESITDSANAASDQ